MSRKRVIIGQSEWTIDERDVETVVEQIRTALTEGTVAELVLLDSLGRPVTVYLNGRTAVTVVVDLDRDPRPSEIS